MGDGFICYRGHREMGRGDLILAAKAASIGEVLEIWRERLCEGVKPGLPLILSISSQNKVFKFLKMQK